MTTEFYLPDLAKLMNKTSNEISSTKALPILNKVRKCSVLHENKINVYKN